MPTFRASAFAAAEARAAGLEIMGYFLGSPLPDNVRVADNEEHSIGSAHVRTAAELKISLRERFR